MRQGYFYGIKGYIEDKIDISYLNVDEILKAIEEETCYKNIIKGRKDEYRKYDKITPPRVMSSEGEILVTKYTDPGWTPIFINANALILEVGGLMTHGAIVAREYGIPALVGLENATTLIKTGDYIRVNAIDGYVERLR